jgi:GT2 family glycosyltransferase
LSDASPTIKRVVSVLVVNWNTRDLLHRCLASLAAVDEAAELEVIVVDNGSIDGSAAMLRQDFPAVLLIENELNLGFTRATNQAFERSSGDYVLMLNSDTIVESGTIRFSRAFLEAHPAVGALGCQLRNEDGTPQSTCFRFPSLFGLLMTSTRLAQTFPENRRLNWDRYGGRGWTGPSEVDVVMGSFLMVRRSACRTPTLLDDAYFMYAEETDLCRRLRDDGWLVMFVPEVSITHVLGASSKTAAQVAWSDEAKKRGILRFLFTWRGPAVAWTANLIMLGGMLPRIIGWAFLDLRESLRARRLRRVQLLRARGLRMHLDLLVQPDKALEPWGGPE